MIGSERPARYGVAVGGDTVGDLVTNRQREGSACGAERVVDGEHHVHIALIGEGGGPVVRRSRHAANSRICIRRRPERLVYRNGFGYRELRADEVNARFKELTDNECSVKDLRTWQGTAPTVSTTMNSGQRLSNVR